MPLFTRKFISDSKAELEVDGSYRFESWDQIEITEVKAWKWEDRNNSSAPYVELTDAERERLYNELSEDESTWAYDDEGHGE